MTGRPCVFGEVLFDHFPGGQRVLGGAPFNVAWHLHAFGAAPFFVSRVGDDAEGDVIRSEMRKWGMDMSGLQTDAQRPTGKVIVEFEDGEPSYDIVHPAAWDAIETVPSVPEISLLYHGSLALREEGTRQTWRQLRHVDPAIVFIDVNLRAPWWRRRQVLEYIQGADWVKLNRLELDQLAPGEGTANSRALAFLAQYDLQGLLLTDGSRGATLLTQAGDHLVTRPQPDIFVADTVGAGDALATVIVLGLLRGWPLKSSLERAQSFASALVGRHGATVADRGFYSAFSDSWSGEEQQEGVVGP